MEVVEQNAFFCISHFAQGIQPIWFSTWGLHRVAPRIAELIAWVRRSPFRPRSWIPELQKGRIFGGFGDMKVMRVMHYQNMNSKWILNGFSWIVNDFEAIGLEFG